MPTICCAPGCGAQTTRYGNYCNTHKSRQRRHGAPDQLAITEPMLRPFMRAVHRRREKNDDNLLWGNLDKRWLGIVDLARSIKASFEGGKAGYWFDFKAADQVLSLADEVPPKDIVDTCLAMYLLHYAEPHRFKTDDAFRVQMVRRVRLLGDAYAERRWNPMTEKLTRAYRELPPRATEVIADWLVGILGGPGVHLAHLEKRDADRQQQEKIEFQQALQEMK